MNKSVPKSFSEEHKKIKNKQIIELLKNKQDLIQIQNDLLRLFLSRFSFVEFENRNSFRNPFEFECTVKQQIGEKTNRFIPKTANSKQ